jgi:hypothetical protein
VRRGDQHRLGSADYLPECVSGGGQLHRGDAELPLEAAQLGLDLHVADLDFD